MNQKLTFKNLDPNYGKLKEKQHEPLQELTKPHVESFNYVLREGLSKAVKGIVPVQFALPNGQRISLFIRDATIFPPMQNGAYARSLKVFPAECRERSVSYTGRLQVSFCWKVNDEYFGPEERILGEVPIMVKSEACNLYGLGPAGLVRHGEEAEEMGGYFIINGLEKVMRMLILQRRNYPLAMCRPSWKNRGSAYTEYGISIKCTKADHTSTNNVLHYLNNGTAMLCLIHRKELFYVPVMMILKALVNVTDQEIYKELVKGMEDNSFYKGCIANMLRMAQAEKLSKQDDVLQYIGERFRFKLDLPEWYTDREVAEFLLNNCFCIHLDNPKDKFHLLVYMTRKLFVFAKGGCAVESSDNPMFQEVLMGGHLYLMALKEKIELWLTSVKNDLSRVAKKKGIGFTLSIESLLAAFKHCPDVGRPMEYLLSTGNLQSRTGLGLMQNTGLVVLADKLNFYRYMSHFRAVHRGAFFSEMRTTAVRKLLPEAFGFLCPVHTPDGSPCGLLNHMTALCEVVNVTYNTSHLPNLLVGLGMTTYHDPPETPYKENYAVMLDGKMIGWIHDTAVESAAKNLRILKVLGKEKVPKFLEICLVCKTKVSSQSPGLYLFSGPSRMMRPVRNLALDSIEMIGSFEQVYLNIAIIPEETYEQKTTHIEIREDSMLSAIASLTPYSDFNQSPRNMYQCQMGKQTMGTPLHAFPKRADNKLYRIQTPQTTLVRPHAYDHYDVDNYPLGTNAIVAVISYTGYDMEDAMILNKGSYERGFGHGSVYKTDHINLVDVRRDKGLRTPLVFGCKLEDKKQPNIDKDGLPFIGTFLQENDPYYSYVNMQTGEYKTVLYRSQEPAYVDQIKVLGNNTGTAELQNIAIVLRIVRNPIIGDKFSSRHGQKGICSQKWPVENMPFTESGMTPDIIFNPHGFPSRMTIGMMIESMAGKSAAMHGLLHDATPFSFSEDNPAIDYFGNMLTKAGYNYYGTERMYSGVTGREFEADIFMGVVYYQRLRHMVSDKFQVRTTGPVDQVTNQPVKGRKRHGGIRFGEMERDGLLSHGTSFLLEDRLLNCSDKSLGFVCSQCGSILSPLIERPESSAAATYESKKRWVCKTCRKHDTVKLIKVPHVFKYLVAELAAMNIKTTLDVKEVSVR